MPGINNTIYGIYDSLKLTMLPYNYSGMQATINRGEGPSRHILWQTGRWNGFRQGRVIPDPAGR